MDAHDFVLSLIAEAQASPDASAERSLGSAGVLSVEFNGGLPFWLVSNSSSSYEPTMTQILDLVLEVL